MPVFSADLLLPVTSPPVPNGWIEINDDGRIKAMGADNPPANAEHLNGILVPGFVNAHCHLELSFLRSSISENAGMAGFVKQLLTIRNATSTDDQSKGMMEACEEMQRNGIIAVGDISNNTISASVKYQSKLNFRTFIEVLGLAPEASENIYESARQMISQFNNPPATDMTLHSTYSVSNDLTINVLRHLESTGSPLSIHMQESEDELQLCKDGKGPLAELFKGMGISEMTFRKYDIAPVLYYAQLFKNISRIMFVHNTYTTANEISEAESIHDGITWCLCPKANLYISGQCPPVDLLLQHAKRIAIGTDSLASNDSLDILSELKIIANKFPSITFDNLIQWSTINGAFALKMENQIGSFEIGKKPGLVLLENINVLSPVFTAATNVKGV